MTFWTCNGLSFFTNGISTLGQLNFFYINDIYFFKYQTSYDMQNQVKVKKNKRIWIYVKIIVREMGKVSRHIYGRLYHERF